MAYIGYIYAVGAAITWGLVYTLDQKILSNASPAALLFVDSILTALLVLPYILINPAGVREVLASGRTNLLIIAFSVLLATLASFFIFSSIKSLNSSAASMIEISYPFFVVLFSYIIFRTSPNIYFFAGGLLIFIGSFIIIRFA